MRRQDTYNRLVAEGRADRPGHFNYALNYRDIDLRKHPDLYRVGRGEEGVLLAEPYKSELLPLWRFKTPEIAQESAEVLRARFEEYRSAGDFIGMDMARKFLQMGFTRSRRYANRRSGCKYDEAGRELPKDQTEDPVKAASAAIFFKAWKEVEADEEYERLKKEWSQSHPG